MAETQLLTISLADVRIPLVAFRFPNGSLSYIPRYSVGSLDRLCKKMIDQGYPVEGLMEREEQRQIQSLERSIANHRLRVKDGATTLAYTLFIPGCQLLLPWILPIVSHYIIYYGIKASKLKGRVRSIKVDKLKDFYSQNQIEE